jgi:hypothetical protein
MLFRFGGDGTLSGHLYLWAMGMISALYVGMPIIAGGVS